MCGVHAKAEMAKSLEKRTAVDQKCIGGSPLCVRLKKIKAGDGWMQE